MQCWILSASFNARIQLSKSLPWIEPEGLTGPKPRGLGFREEAHNLALRTGGADRDRTDDLLVANQALSQLSYSPACLDMVGLGRFELPTSRLSGVRSNQLSYRPSTRPGSHLPGTFPTSGKAEGRSKTRPRAFGEKRSASSSWDKKLRGRLRRSGGFPARDPGSLSRSLKTK